ncbi:NTE [Acanthosepion pharaonis]|uniref:lysophospholipase n=1 Tax=Acanthosepion pharaonis TaxID=158019 RepID=A0A812AM60_ACAPH|nr:NTE [Sepia pharaonis]
MNTADTNVEAGLAQGLTWGNFYQIEISMSLFWLIFLVLGMMIFSVLYWCVLNIKARVLATEREKSKIRFRKRDKVMFYGKKMLRKVKTFTKNDVLGPRGRMKKRQLVLKIAKRLLQRKRESQPLLVQKEPPRSFLEVDSSEQDDSESRLPPDVVYMLRSVRVFGHFQKDLFLELCRHFERKFIPAHTYLFRIGDNDDSIYVVESGKINVYITESDNIEYLVKEVQTGESIHSLLSIVDVLTGHPSPFKTVTAKAVEDTNVLKLPVQSFQSVFELYPDSLVRVVQIIMVRLQRVTFLALHKYLGLSTELINPATAPEENIKSLNIYALAMASSVSPYQSTNIKDTQSTPSLLVTSSDSMSLTDIASSSSEKLSRHSLSDSSGNPKSVLSHSISEEEAYDPLVFENECMRGRVQTIGYQRSVPGGLAPVRLSDDELEMQRMNIKRHGSDPMGYSLTMGRTLIDQKKIELVKQDLTNLFKLKDPNLLDGKLTLKQFRAGSILQKQGDQDSSLFFIVTGTLNVLQNLIGHEEKETLLFSAGLGRVVGALAVLTGEPSMFTVKSKTESEVVLISKMDFYSIMKKQPSIVLQAAHTIVSRMSSFVRQIDFALDWTMLEAGRALFSFICGKTDYNFIMHLFLFSFFFFSLSFSFLSFFLFSFFFFHFFFFFSLFLFSLFFSFSFFSFSLFFFSLSLSFLSLFLFSLSFFSLSFFSLSFFSLFFFVILINSSLSASVTLYHELKNQLDYSFDRQDDPCNSIYIILTGRLRSIITSANNKKELVGEYGRGDLVGIVEALTQTQRATTVMAVRDTELADIPSELLNHIKRKYPQIVTRLIHLLGQRLLGNLQSRTTDQLQMENRMIVSNLSTVAVVPISSDVPLENFTLELQHALNAIGPTARITSEIVKNRLGNTAFNSLNEFRLFSWLGQHEDINRMVLFQCDNTMNRWTKHFVRQADCILIVGIATNDPSVLGEVEAQLENIAVRAQKELILLHREDADTPRRTADWLNARGWCSSHHHIRCPKRVFSRKSKEKSKEVYAKLFESEPDKLTDFSRLARFLTGTSIGLVLGGGGARGISHMGMIRAMAESGIPIDMVGGTSIGSIMGAIWAESRDVTRSVQRAREWSKEMTSLWKKILDLTYPVTSMFTGSTFNKSLENLFQDRQIEDLWIPYFCITTDISASSMRVHTTGEPFNIF